MLKQSFKIDNEIYKDSFVNQAIIDFEWYNITFFWEELIISGETSSEIQEIFNEFMNYVIALYNESL